MNMKTVLILLGAILLAGCVRSAQDHMTDGPGMEKGWHEISREEAKKMMEQDDGHIILDVREREEYDSGFIPGAICIPLGRIDDTAPALLPDKEQIILVYCRSGNRSKQAAAKLAAMGYTNIYEFGGIKDWDGPVIREEEVMEPMPIYILWVNDRHFTFDPADNETAKAFIEQLDHERLDTEFTALDETAMAGPLSWPLPGEAEETEYNAGDILTDLDGRILICTGSGSGPYVRLAGTAGHGVPELLEALAGETAEVSFFIEWTE